MKRWDDKGFTAVEGILIVVLLGLLGAIGWFVYERSGDDKNETQIVTTSEDNQVSEENNTSDALTTDAMTLEKSFEVNGKTVAFNYPSAWESVDSNKGELAILTHSSGYTLRFTNTNTDLSGFDLKESQVTLGGKQFTKGIYSQGGIDSLILYTPKFDAPFTNAWLDLPNNVSKTVIEEVEQVLATLQLN